MERLDAKLDDVRGSITSINSCQDIITLLPSSIKLSHHEYLYSIDIITTIDLNGYDNTLFIKRNTNVDYSDSEETSTIYLLDISSNTNFSMTNIKSKIDEFYEILENPSEPLNVSTEIVSLSLHQDDLSIRDALMLFGEPRRMLVLIDNWCELNTFGWKNLIELFGDQNKEI